MRKFPVLESLSVALVIAAIATFGWRAVSGMGAVEGGLRPGGVTEDVAASGSQGFLTTAVVVLLALGAITGLFLARRRGTGEGNRTGAVVGIVIAAAIFALAFYSYPH